MAMAMVSSCSHPSSSSSSLSEHLSLINFKENPLVAHTQASIEATSCSVSSPSEHGTVYFISGLEPEMDSVAMKIEIQTLQREILHLQKLRSEDGKANARVVSMFASREQGWKDERRKLKDDKRKLCQELQSPFIFQEMLKETMNSLKKLQSDQQVCLGCKNKERVILELRESLCQEEIWSLASMEEVQAEKQEKKKILEKKNSLEALLEVVKRDCESRCVDLQNSYRKDLQEMEEKMKQANDERGRDLGDQSAEWKKYEEDSVRMVSEMEQFRKVSRRKEQDLVWMVSEIDRLRKDYQDKEQQLISVIEQLREESRDVEEYVVGIVSEIDRLRLDSQGKDKELVEMLSELRWYQKDSADKEKMICAMLEKSKADGEDRQEAKRELSILKIRYKHCERECEKWKRMMMNNTNKNTNKKQKKNILLDENCFVRGEVFEPSKTGFSYNYEIMIEEMQRQHNAEIRDLQYAFEEKFKVLQQKQQERICHHPEEETLTNLTMGSSLELEHLEEEEEEEEENSMGIIIAPRKGNTSLEMYKKASFNGEDLQRWKETNYFTSKATATPTIGMLRKECGGLNSNIRDLFKLENARFASKLQQKHRLEIDAFERQIKVRDEKMSAFKRQLLKMEDGARKKNYEIEALKIRLAQVTNDRDGRQTEKVFEISDRNFGDGNLISEIPYEKCVYISNGKLVDSSNEKLLEISRGRLIDISTIENVINRSNENLFDISNEKSTIKEQSNPKPQIHTFERGLNDMLPYEAQVLEEDEQHLKDLVEQLIQYSEINCPGTL